MLKKFTFTLIIIIASLTVIEIASRQFESSLQSSESNPKSDGWQVRFFGQLMDWHESDPELLWRFKKNLKGRLIKTDSNHLLVSDKQYDSNLTDYKILLLGDSSPVGLGLTSRNQVFGELLEYILCLKSDGLLNIQLINASVSGYSSAQLARQIEPKIKEYSPDLVIVYCGNNDASISGRMSDKELLDLQQMVWLRNLTNKLAVYRLMRGWFQSVSKTVNINDQQLKVRVTPDEFEDNLLTIITNCQKSAIPLIIIKPPVPRFWPASLQFRPFLDRIYNDGELLFPSQIAEMLNSDILYCLDPDWLNKLYGKTDTFTKLVYNSAISLSDSLANRIIGEASDSNNPIALNNIGVAHWWLGEYDQSLKYLEKARTEWHDKFGDNKSKTIQVAGSPILYNLGIVHFSIGEENIDELYLDNSIAYRYLDSALQLDYFSLRIKQNYLDRIDSLAIQEEYFVLNADSLFAANSGEKLFVDHCHPTAEGHILIARTLAELIMSQHLLQ